MGLENIKKQFGQEIEKQKKQPQRQFYRTVISIINGKGVVTKEPITYAEWLQDLEDEADEERREDGYDEEF